MRGLLPRESSAGAAAPAGKQVENTLGRQYEGKGLHPEIVVHDPGISRRHLKFIRNAAGGYSVLELCNGTEFNCRALETGITLCA